MVKLLYKTVCILISGKIGSGKSSFATTLEKQLKERGYNVLNTSFAINVKKIARFIGWNGEKDDAGRKLLQEIGTSIRNYNKDAWVSKLIDVDIPTSKSYPFDVVIIDDWRYENEYDYISTSLMYDVIPVRIHGRGEDSNHESEHAIDVNLHPNMYYLENTSTLEELEKSANNIADYIEREFNRGEK